MIWTANIPIAGQISSSLQSFFLIPLLSNLSFASFRLSFSRYSFPTILFPLSFSLLFTLSFPHYSFRSFSHFFPLSFSDYLFPLSFSILSPFCIALLPFAGIGCFLKMQSDEGLGTWGWPSSKTPSKPKALPGGCRAYSLAR